MKPFNHKDVVNITLECECDVDMSEIESYADYVRNKQKELIRKGVYEFLEGLVDVPQPRSNYDYTVYAGVCMAVNKIADYLINKESYENN